MLTSEQRKALDEAKYETSPWGIWQALDDESLSPATIRRATRWAESIIYDADGEDDPDAYVDGEKKHLGEMARLLQEANLSDEQAQSLRYPYAGKGEEGFRIILSHPEMGSGKMDELSFHQKLLPDLSERELACVLDPRMDQVQAKDCLSALRQLDKAQREQVMRVYGPTDLDWGALGILADGVQLHPEVERRFPILVKAKLDSWQMQTALVVARSGLTDGQVAAIVSSGLPEDRMRTLFDIAKLERLPAEEISALAKADSDRLTSAEYGTKAMLQLPPLDALRGINLADYTYKQILELRYAAKAKKLGTDAIRSFADPSLAPEVMDKIRAIVQDGTVAPAEAAQVRNLCAAQARKGLRYGDSQEALLDNLRYELQVEHTPFPQAVEWTVEKKGSKAQVAAWRYGFRSGLDDKQMSQVVRSTWSPTHIALAIRAFQDGLGPKDVGGWQLDHFQWDAVRDGLRLNDRGTKVQRPRARVQDAIRLVNAECGSNVIYAALSECGEHPDHADRILDTAIRLKDAARDEHNVDMGVACMGATAGWTDEQIDLASHEAWKNGATPASRAYIYAAEHRLGWSKAQQVVQAAQRELKGEDGLYNPDAWDRLDKLASKLANESVRKPRRKIGIELF